MAQAAVTAQAFTALDLAGGERNLIGLARVSADAQDAQLQQDALALARCGRVYVEKGQHPQGRHQAPRAHGGARLPAARRHAVRVEARPAGPLRQGGAHDRR